jgi:glycosyltransferase involved in cell wall biosynthesis
MLFFHKPVQDIEHKYVEASFYLMTSRFEGFGMVLIEAMASGLPCVAYDCPCGPRGVLTHGEDGF